MKNYLSIMLFALLACSVAACQMHDAKQANDLDSPETFYYRSTGVIKLIDQPNMSVRIDHEDIPGYMPAMEMEMGVGDPEMIKILKVGDVVDFDLERVGANLTITSMSKKGVDDKVRAMDIYAVSCAECHGAKGEGAEKGIPFTSGHALHHTEAEFIRSVTGGKNLKKEKHMPAFRDELSNEEIRSVVSFIRNDIQAGMIENKVPAKHTH